MLHNKTIAVIVPAYNEEKQIGFVMESMPEFVDRIIVINDCSKDKTKEQVLKCMEKFAYSRLNGNSNSTLSKFLLISFFKRIWYKYFLLDMHPISLLYFMSLLLMIVMIPFTASLFYQAIVLVQEVNLITLFIYISLFILLIQSLMFAMWFDIQDNKKLYKQ